MRRDAFYSVHPAAAMLFFVIVTVTTALILHPVVTGCSLIAACAYAVYLKGGKALKFCLCFVLPLIAIVAVLNPVFNHAGATALFYFRNGNAVTLEAVLYGVNSACMFAALTLWFYCLNCVMSSDKYDYLFGKTIPVLSLVFSMVLRFVPRFVSRIREVAAAQRSLEPRLKMSPVRAVKHGLSVIGVTVTWALEGAVVQADSMKSRGYGLKGRTSFSRYKFEKRDGALLALMLVCFAVYAAAAALKRIDFRYYPTIRAAGCDAPALAGYAAFALLCLIPLLLNILEDAKWRALRSKI